MVYANVDDLLQSSSRSEVDNIIQDGFKLRVVQDFGENVR